MPDEEVATALTDLLCDLVHLADALGIDFAAAAARAERDHCAELFI